MAAELPEAGRVALCVAIGCAEILESVATTDQRDDPVLLVLVVLLVLLALITCLLLAIIVDLELAAAALSPAAVLGWLGNLAINIKLAVALRISGFELYMIGNVVVLAARN